MPKDYYYLRSGILHKKYVVDEAVQLSKDEEDRIKEEMRKNPAMKQDVYERHWSLYAKVMGRKTFRFKEWFDGYCDEKRRRNADGRKM